MKTLQSSISIPVLLILISSFWKSPSESTLLLLDDFVCSGPITLLTQADVNAFSCTGPFSGNLTIGPSTDITDLSPLNGITSVSGVLRIDQNDVLVTLNGLQSLVSGHGVVISANDQLQNLNGLNNLDFVTLNFALIDNPILSDISSLVNLNLVGNASLNILNNDALTNLSGLGGVTYGNAISIENNDGLVDLNGLNNLTGAGSWLRIRYNGLVSLNGLQNLTQVVNALNIEYNNSLSNVDALSNLSTIGQDLGIRYNASLQNVDGFTSLLALNNLSVIDNDMLTNLDGFSNLQSVLDALYVIGNDGLTSCCGIYTALSSGPLSAYISGNLGCAMASDILNGCIDQDGDGFTTAQGDCDDGNAAIFPGAVEKCNGIDDNCDGQIDEDQGSSPAQVIINSQAELDALPAYTIINGNLNIIGTDVSDLSPLSCLVEIKNGLHIYGNTNLTTLSGLESLVKVKGITIRDNPNLVNTDALNFLSEVGTDGVEFKNNNALTHISLSGLTSIQYSATDLCIDISENDQLTTISVQSIQEIPGRLFIVNNHNLSNLEMTNLNSVGQFDFINSSISTFQGFPQLTEVLISLNLNGHTLMTDFGDLAHVEVGQGIYINNVGVSDLQGLTTNTDIDVIHITQCQELTDIGRLANFTSIGNWLNISRNPQLTDCCPVAQLIDGGINIITIELNDLFCNSADEIIAHCIDQDGDGFTTAQGDCDDGNAEVYPGAVEICNGLDDDCDQMVDEDETPPIAICASTSQTILDFDHLLFNDNQRHFYNTIQEDGFTLSQQIPAQFPQNGDNLVIHGTQSGFWWKGSPAVWLTLASNPPTYAVLSKDDGSLFTIQSLSVATQIGSSVPQNFTVEGVKADATVVSQSFISQSASQLVPFSLNSDFEDLVAFRWATQSDGAFQVDDIVISTMDPVELILDENGVAQLEPAQIDGGSFDDCGPVSLSLSQADFSCADLGVVQVTLTITDETGNSSTCSVPVNVVDNLPPTLSGTPGDLTVDCQSIPDVPEISAADNCSAEISFAETSTYDGLCSNYQITRTWLASDPSGNSVVYEQIITVEDNAPPTIQQCPQSITVPSLETGCGANVNWEDPIAVDCSQIIITSTHNSGEFFALGTTMVSYTFTDACGNNSNCVFSIEVVDATSPVPDQPTLPDLSGCSVTVVSPSATDACDGAIQGSTLDPTFYDVLGTYLIHWIYEDVVGNISTQDQQVTVVDILAPEIIAVVVPPDPIVQGSSVATSGTFTDACDKDDHTASWDWGDGNQSSGSVDQTTNEVSGSHIYATPGVYTITLTITDGSQNEDVVVSTTYAVIYEPSEGFVTGGGWIQSPLGAYVADPNLSGKANFGFVSKYKNGANVPTGNTSFHLNVANFKFKSTEYEWLVIAGSKAKFKGSGEVNNQGDYGFMITGIDGQVNGGGGLDKFRIKIWDKGNGHTVVYDNKMGADDAGYDTQELGGGSITIHKSDVQSRLIPVDGNIPDGLVLTAFPNPFNARVTLDYVIPVSGMSKLAIYDIHGRVIKTLLDAFVQKGEYQIEWNGNDGGGNSMPSGIYTVKLSTEQSYGFKQIIFMR